MLLHPYSGVLTWGILFHFCLTHFEMIVTFVYSLTYFETWHLPWRINIAAVICVSLRINVLSIYTGLLIENTKLWNWNVPWQPVPWCLCMSWHNNRLNKMRRNGMKDNISITIIMLTQKWSMCVSRLRHIQDENYTRIWGEGVTFRGADLIREITFFFHVTIGPTFTNMV